MQADTTSVPEVTTRPGMKLLHRFRGKIVGLAVFGGKLIIATDRGVYRMATSRSKPRKIKLAP